jgi:hypothetical protein
MLALTSTSCISDEGSWVACVWRTAIKILTETAILEHQGKHSNLFPSFIPIESVDSETSKHSAVDADQSHEVANELVKKSTIDLDISGRASASKLASKNPCEHKCAQSKTNQLHQMHKSRSELKRAGTRVPVSH